MISSARTVLIAAPMDAARGGVDRVPVELARRRGPRLEAMQEVPVRTPRRRGGRVMMGTQMYPVRRRWPRWFLDRKSTLRAMPTQPSPAKPPASLSSGGDGLWQWLARQFRIAA